jgi:hypothetical protein
VCGERGVDPAMVLMDCPGWAKERSGMDVFVQ